MVEIKVEVKIKTPSGELVAFQTGWEKCADDSAPANIGKLVDDYIDTNRAGDAT